MLLGDPGKDGVFAARWAPKGYHVPPHTHPKQETSPLSPGPSASGLATPLTAPRPAVAGRRRIRRRHPGAPTMSTWRRTPSSRSQCAWVRRDRIMSIRPTTHGTSESDQAVAEQAVPRTLGRRSLSQSGLLMPPSWTPDNGRIGTTTSGPQSETAPRFPGRRFLFDALLFRSGRGEVAELLQARLLRLVARRQLEQPRRGAAEDVVLGLFRQERQVADRRRQVEVPVRIVG